MADMPMAERRQAAKQGQAMPGGRYPIKNRCITGDSLIPLLDGRRTPIADLVGTEPWIYAFDLEQRAIVPAQATNIRITEQDAEIIEVRLDSGDSVRCTANHPFLMLDRTYRAAGMLLPGDRLMPLYRGVKKLGTSPDGLYEQTWQPYYGFWEWTHRLVFRHVNGQLPDRGHVVHHRNGDPFDNRPDNLEDLTHSEHRRHHQAEDRGSHVERLAAAREARWAKPGARQEWSERVRSREDNTEMLHTIRTKANAARRRDFPADEAYRAYLAGETWVSLAERYGVSKTCLRDRFKELGYELRGSNPVQDRIANIRNHKVVAVVPAGHADVYDLSVPGVSNFALAAGVFVHNSDLENAIRAVGRVKPTGDESPEEARAMVRRHIARRAKALNLSNLVPENWAADGSLKS